MFASRNDMIHRRRSVAGLIPHSGRVAALLIFFFLLLFCSLPMATDYSESFHASRYLNPKSIIVVVALTGLIAPIFVFARFSFGYFVGFYLFSMMTCYFWFNTFGVLGYDRNTGLISAAASIVAFLIPAVLCTGAIKQFVAMPHRLVDVFPPIVLSIGLIVLLTQVATRDYRFVELSEMDNYRATLNNSAFLRYFIGIFLTTLLPFSFACAWMRKRWYVLVALCAISTLYYPLTFNKTSLLTPLFLVFVALLTLRFEGRKAVILSLLIPIFTGLVAADLNISHLIFSVANFRVLAVPALSLEHYYAFFSDHPLTYFCQIGALKNWIDCPYQEQLGIVLSNWFRIGNLNASLFATEGVASVGPLLAPLSAFICGMITAIGNRTSDGLPPPFVMLSGATMPITLMNVPMSTTLLSHGLGVLFLLWYLIPRTYFRR